MVSSVDQHGPAHGALIYGAETQEAYHPGFAMGDTAHVPVRRAPLQQVRPGRTAVASGARRRKCVAHALQPWVCWPHCSGTALGLLASL